MTTFVVLGIAGLALVAVSLVLGDLFDGIFDALAGDVFSSAVLGGFVSAFGFGGAIATSAGLPVLPAVLIGAVAGVLVGWFAGWLTRLVRSGSSDDTLVADDALGRTGTVVTAIPAGGFGIVRLSIGGHVVRLNARSTHPVETGTEVHVTEILSPTAVIVSTPWQELEDPTGPAAP